MAGDDAVSLAVLGAKLDAVLQELAALRIIARERDQWERGVESRLAVGAAHFEDVERRLEEQAQRSFRRDPLAYVSAIVFSAAAGVGSWLAQK